MSEDTGKGLARAYQSAGQHFLAYRLAKLFVRIETPTDIALHNDIVGEVLLIINKKDYQPMVGGGMSPEEKSFFRDLAGTILYQPVDRRKRFLFRVAGKILELGQKKG